MVRPFRAPPTPWSPGHRGVDLGAGVGQPVLTTGDGVVAFAGSVAGRGVVTVGHAGGLRTTYEPVAPAVRAGQAVVRGQRIGVLSSARGHCAPSGCLHWGLRRGTDYLDPLQLLVPAEPPVLKPLWD